MGVPADRRLPPRADGRPRLTAQWLRRRYVEQRRSAQDIAAETGWSSQYVRDRLRDHDIALRSAGNSANLPPVDPAALAGWSGQGLSLAQIAARTGYTRSGVRKLLRRAGLPARAAPAPASPDPTELAEVVRRYRDESRSLTAVGAAFGRGPDWAKARVRAAGLTIRPGGTPRIGWDVEQLRRWRIDDGLSITEIAARTGRSPAAVAAALREAGVPAPRRRTKPALDPAVLRRLYVEQRLTRRLDDPAIAARYGVPPWRVTARRRERGVTRPPVPPPHPDPPPTPPAAVLRRLYLDERLPTAAIGARYGTDPKTARRWLREAGIGVRPRTAREHRHTLDNTELRELYQHRQWTAAEIAAHLETTTRLVLRALHDAGVPVRRGGIRPSRRLPEQTRLLTALYTDLEIATVLRRHRVPRRPRPGPIATRFPTPVPLTAQLLTALYTETGLSARQIELLTGQPHEQVLDALPRAGIPVRRGTGSSPWLTRQRAIT